MLSCLPVSERPNATNVRLMRLGYRILSMGAIMTDIFTRLKQDHDRHREMLERVADTSGDSKEAARAPYG
jgi:hypothetical protein